MRKAQDRRTALDKWFRDEAEKLSPDATQLVLLALKEKGDIHVCRALAQLRVDRRLPDAWRVPIQELCGMTF